ncbi:hypothetical protein [Streptomyces sp. MMG1121]|uniref:hypothetical protein n=1 Tax=Streptomyces sp. MMG1121 TaxID=1415544 RepID=UPI0006AEEF77|nr:hypothetical protein [Streptomyces sp. MMG1121]KOV58167.1 hypothetical protein ADK64_37425 [Streptomyces sp. MMG1121]
MKKLAKRVALTVSSVAVAGVSVLGAGGTASAAALEPTHVQRSTVQVETADHSWDNGVGYLLERGYSCDEVHGWHRVTDATRHDCDGRFYREGHFYRDGHSCRWEDERHGWTSDRSYQHDEYGFEHDGRGWNHHDPGHSDR